MSQIKAIWTKAKPHLMRVLVGSGIMVYVLNLLLGTSTLLGYILYTLIAYLIGWMFVKGNNEDRA